MEMDNSGVSQLVTTQTQLLQQMQQQLQQMQVDRQQEKINQNMTSSSFPVNPPSVDMMSGQPTNMANNDINNPTFSPQQMPGVTDPTSYQTFGTPMYTGSTKTMGNTNGLTPKGLFSEAVEEFRGFDASRTSKEGMDAYFSNQMRGVQEGAVTAAGAAGKGAAFAASFMIPGLLPALAGGAAVAGGAAYVGNSMQGGARTALDYQEILRKDGYKAFNAFESTTEFGGIGMKLDDRQELSGFLRDLAPEKFLEDEEMQKILTGALDNKLLKSTSDVESFKKKFTDIVDTVKQITITMDQSIDEATAFMGELERRGVGTTNMSNVAGQTKVVSSMLGVDTNVGSQLVLNNADQVVQGTSMDAKLAIDSTSQSIYAATIIEEEAKANGDPMYNYMKNSGGTGQIAAEAEQMVRGFGKSDVGKNYLLGFFGSAVEKEGDNFAFNQEKLNELLSGGYSVDQMEQMSSANLDGMASTDAAKVIGSIGDMWSNNASGLDNYRMLNKVQEIYQTEAGADMDPETALVQMGLATDYEQADFLNQMIQKSTDPNNAAQFAAKAYKEEMDSAALAESPSLFKQANFWWKRNVTNELGDMGQGISDQVGDTMQSYQKLLTGIDERGIVGGELLNELTAEGLSETFSNSSKNINENLETYYESKDDLKGFRFGVDKIDKEYAEGKAEAGKSEFSMGSFDVMINDISSGTYNSTDFKRLQDRIDAGEITDMADATRAEYVINKANGEYDGFWGTMKQGVDRVNVTGTALGEKMGEFLPSGWSDDPGKDLKSLFGGGSDQTKEALDIMGEKIQKESKGLNKDLNKLFTSSADLGVDEGEYGVLEKYIKLGLVDEVKGMTKSTEALDLAKRYESISKEKTSYESGVGNFSEMTRTTQAMGLMGQQLADFVSSTGVFEEDELHSLFDGMRDDGKDMIKDLEKGKLTKEEMYEESQKMQARGKEIFSDMSAERTEEIAQQVVAKSGGTISMEDMFLENTNYVDSDKLYDIVSNEVIRQANVGDDPTKDKKKEGGEDVAASTKKTTDGHKQAMYDMLATLEEETAAMRTTANNLQNRNNSGSTYSSVTSK